MLLLWRVIDREQTLVRSAEESFRGAEGAQNGGQAGLGSQSSKGKMGACVSELITRAFLDGVYHNEPQLVQASNSL